MGMTSVVKETLDKDDHITLIPAQQNYMQVIPGRTELSQGVGSEVASLPFKLVPEACVNPACTQP